MNGFFLPVFWKTKSIYERSLVELVDWENSLNLVVPNFKFLNVWCCICLDARAHIKQYFFVYHMASFQWNLSSGGGGGGHAICPYIKYRIIWGRFDTVLGKCPLVRVSLEDRFYCITIWAAQHLTTERTNGYQKVYLHDRCPLVAGASHC